MPKYSLIVTAYNVEQYISKCLKSLLNQTFNNYEIIIIDDGSTDKTNNILQKYKTDKINIYRTENKGVSSARNLGVSKAKGTYFTFIDSDDYIDKNFLRIIDGVLDNKTEVLSFNLSKVDEKGNVLKNFYKPSFYQLNGPTAIKRFILNTTFFDTPVAYVYKTSYFKNNKFKYAAGKYHEDFGLTPLIIIKASYVTSIKDSLYFYVQRKNSITQSKQNTIKKAYDMLYHFDYLYNEINNVLELDNNIRKIFNSFLANAVIDKAKDLNQLNRKKYILELKKRRVTLLLLEDNCKRKLKKIIIKRYINLYLKFTDRRKP